ncbi:hypothetical protein TIFTF001_007565 [Ficus carica]|uniref:Uncharacterized protein n=1 Tax=Ficus carica TaxID=3494 RepID=A0AA88DGI9_FICCA|nr:hypothetical protein TIFTF001_007565 [Ficus carica]
MESTNERERALEFLERPPHSRMQSRWKSIPKGEQHQQQQRKVKKAQQQPSVDGSDQERGPDVWLGLFAVDDDDDDKGGPGISILVYGDNRVLGLFVADDCEVPLSLWVSTC